MKKLVYRISLLLFSTLATEAMAQRLPEPAQQDKNPQNLEELFRQKCEQQTAQVLAKAKQLNVPVREELPNGTVREMRYISPTGMPVYVQTDNNLDAAKTISTNKVWPGGTTGTSLTGLGMTARLGVWDGGAVRTSHQEFNSRATQIDGSSTLSDHATHVAGTMVAKGVVANAKGMSYEAPIKCYDWTSDVSEMTSAAAAGMLVSNHSYSQISGWQYNTNLNRWEFWGDPSVSTTEDYKYGYYDYDCQDFDQVAVSYPNYLAFVAAGNDRGEPGTIPSSYYIRDLNGNWVLGSSSNPPSAIGPYDCISGGQANAKNVLTIGAVNKITTGWTKSSDVVMSSFSGWGPTDDGRIKPDVVANGVSVNSCISTSNTAYATYNGTSMATPNASGSGLLIQQHYFNLKGSYMRGATLKGLIIHTADEAGTSTGPDYTYGWGLMNTAKAVSTISDSLKSLISQNSYTSGTYAYTFFSDGTAPIRATIAWADRPATPVNPAVDPSNRMLVNDLDIRIRRNSDNQLFYPYVLNKSNPSTAATTGDNNVDNVEQVYIALPAAGTYTILVTGKSTMVGGAQPYSLILSGITPKPSAAFTTASRVVCANRTVSFTDQSSGASSRMWYFPGGSPATSTATNPSVTYTVPGVYPVALRISSSTGYDSVYKDDYIVVGGLPLPLTETFENNSPTRSLWTVENPNADSTFRLWNVAGNSPGNLAMGINNFDYPTNYLLDRLLSPVLDLRGYTDAKLEFQHAYTRYDNTSSDSLIVYVSTNCGSNYTRLVAYGENGTGNFATAPDSSFTSTNRFEPTKAEDWCGGTQGAACISVNLTPYVGNANVRIRIEQKSLSGNNLFIDNINITGTNKTPVANFYALTRTVCVGDEVQLLDSSLNKPDQWHWYVSDADTAEYFIRNPKVRFTSQGTKTISLVAKNAMGQDSVARINYITVLPSPQAPVLTSSKGLTLCDGDSTVISSTATSNFVWYKNNLPYSTSITSFTNKEEALFYQRVLGGNGCWTKSEELPVVTGTTPAKPVITKDLTGTNFCEGGSFNLYSSAAAGNQWFANDTLFTGKTGTSLNYNAAGEYKVRISDKGCNAFSDSLVLNMLPRPQPSEISGMSWAVKGDTATYTVTPGMSGSVFNWTLSGGVLQSGATTPQVVVKFNNVASATINVQENASNGCKSAVKTIAVNLVNTGLNQAKNNALQVYPNPVHNQLIIQTQALLSNGGQLKITDMLGRTMKVQNIMAGADVSAISVSELSPGMYTLSIETPSGTYTVSWIKD